MAGQAEHPRDTVYLELEAERLAQDAKWGEQSHPDGTGGYIESRHYAREACQSAASRGECTWRLILTEEFYEALAESDPKALRAELLQVAAVAVAWVEAIDRRPVATENA